MSNKITLTIQAKDEATNVLKGLTGNLENYKNKNKELVEQLKTDNKNIVALQKKHYEDLRKLQTQKEDTKSKLDLSQERQNQNAKELERLKAGMAQEQKTIITARKQLAQLERQQLRTQGEEQQKQIAENIKSQNQILEKAIANKQAYYSRLGQIDETQRQKEYKNQLVKLRQDEIFLKQQQALALKPLFIKKSETTQAISYASSTKSILDKDYSSASAEVVKLEKEIAQLTAEEAKLGTTVKVTSEELMNRLITNKQLMSQAKELTQSQKELLFIEQKRLYAEQEAKNLNKTTLEQLREKIALNKQQPNVVATQKQKDTFNKEQFNLYKQELAEKEKLSLQNEKEKKSLRDVYQQTYVNTKAQNQYADAVARLNKMKAIGAITQKEYSQGLAKAKQSIDANEKSTSNLANTTIRYLRWAGTIAGTFYAVQRAWDLTLGKGIEVNRMIEDNTTGIAALLGANTSMILSNGKVVNSYEKFQLGLSKSKEIMDNIRVAAKSTYATFPQLTEIYQQAIGQTLSFGTSFGRTVDEISSNTVKLAQRMSNIGGAIGQPMDRIKEEIRSLISGNASTDSIISTMIFGSPTQANEAIRRAKATGTNGLKDMLESYIGVFDVLEGVKTYTKAQLDLQDAISQTQAQLAEPTFNALKEVFTDVALQINKMKDDKTFQQWGENIVSVAKAIVDIADEVAIALASFLGWKLITPIIESVTKSFGAAQAAAAQLAVQGKATSTAMIMMSNAARTAKASLIGLASSLAPLAAVMVAYEGYNWLIGDNIEKEEKLRGIMSQKIDDLNKMSSSQLIYNKALLEEQLLIKTKEVQDAKAKVANKGIFGKSELEQKADSAALSVAQEELTNLIKVKHETSNVLALREKIQAQLNVAKDTQKELGDLTVKLTRNSKVEEEVKGFVKKEEEEIVKLAKQKKEWSDELIKSEKTLGELRQKYSDKNTIKFEDIDEIKKQQEYISSLKEGILQTEKAITEENEKKAIKSEAVLKKEYKTALELNREYAEQQSIKTEIALIEAGIFDDEKLKVQLSGQKLNSLATEYSLLSKTEDKEKIKLELLREGLKYEQLISIEQQLRGDKSETVQDLIIVNEQLLGIEKNITSQKSQTFFEQLALTAMKVQELLVSKQITQAEADAFNTKIQGIAETRIAQENYQKNLKEGIKDFDDMINNIKNQTVTIDFKMEGFSEVTNSLASVANSIIDIVNANNLVSEQEEILKETRKNYPKDIVKIGAEEKKLTKLREKDSSNQIAFYGKMTGALQGFTKEGSKEYKALGKVQEGMYMAEFAMNAARMVQQVAASSLFVTSKSAEATASGVAAVANQGSGDPYTAFGRMAAMAAIIASLGLAVGGLASGGKTSTSIDAFSAMKANEGKGSVLGDAEAVSESIVNSLEILEKYKKPEFQTLQSMNKYLANISNNIGGLTSILFRNENYALGQGFTPVSSTKQNITMSSKVQAALGLGANATYGAGVGILSGSGALAGALAGTGIGLGIMAIDKVLLGGAISNIIGGAVNSVLGGLFGKTSVKSEMTDSGIYFADTLLKNAIEEFEGSAYQTIKTTTKKKSWFSSSSSSEIKTYFAGLNEETERQFSLVLSSIYGTVFEAGGALDMDESSLINKLDNFVVKIGKISLKDKTGAEIQETLTNIFGKVGDDLAKAVFPALIPFQKVGEGMFETLTRVATGMEEAEYYINRLGVAFEDLSYTQILNKSGDVGFEALLQSIIKVDERVYGLNNNLVQIVSSLNSTAEELYSAYKALDAMRESLKFLKLDTDAISYSSIRGAGGLEALSDGISSYIENFLTEEEQLSYQTTLLIKEFNSLNMALPVGKDGFKELIKSLDLSTDSGQELYGRLMTLSGGFAEVANKTEKANKVLEEFLSEQSNQFRTVLLGVAAIGVAFLDITKSIETTVLALKGQASTDTANIKAQYWTAREEADKLLSKGSNISTSESERLKALSDTFNSLALSMQKSKKGDISSLTSSLIQDLTGVSSKVDFSNQVLKVSIVDGLGSLLGLNQEQVTQLKIVANDGKITTDELKSISGLTQVQQDGITEFAKESKYFSTENTLSSLNEYMKKQLEVLQKTQAEETASLSKQTFIDGDYVGKQEQIDIAKLLGVSYESAKPLIEQVQALSVSKNPTADLQKMLGYTGKGDLDYDVAKASMLSELAPYVGSVDVGKTISGIQGNITTDKAEIAKAETIKQSQIRALYLQINKENIKETLWENYKQVLAMAKNFSAGGFDYDSEHGNIARKYTTSVLGETLPGSIRYGGGEDYTSFEKRVIAKFNGQLNSISYSDSGIMDASKYYNPHQAFYKVPDLSGLGEQGLLLSQLENLRGYAVGSPYLERDQIAQLHQGEGIIPKTFNEGIRGGELILGDIDKITKEIQDKNYKLQMPNKTENKENSSIIIQLQETNRKLQEKIAKMADNMEKMARVLQTWEDKNYETSIPSNVNVIIQG